MKRILILAAVAAAALLSGACASTPKGPEAVALKAVKAIQNGNFDEYAATFDLSEADQKMLAGMAEEKVNKQIAAKGGIKDYKIVESEIEEDSASVKVKINYKDGSDDDEVMNFKKVGDTWKQVINK